MAQDGQPVQLAGRSTADDQAMADLLDPVALEERLRDARIRRTEALARRNTDPGTRAKDPSAPRPTPPHATPVVAKPATALAGPERAAASQPSAPRSAPRPVVAVHPVAVRPVAMPPGDGPGAVAAPVRRTRILPLVMFIAGASLGAALVAVVAMPSLRLRLAMMLAPEAMLISEPATPPSVASAAPVAPSLPVDPVPAPVTAPAAARAPVAAGVATAPTADTAASSSPAPSTVILTPAEPPANANEGFERAMGSGEAHGPATAPVAAEPAPSSPPVPLPSRIVLHYPASAEAEAMAARERLLAAGVGDVQAVPVRFAIGRTNVRFYHGVDAEGARGVADLLAREGDAVPEARDFTDYPSPAAAGKVEVWFSGSPTAARATSSRLIAPTATPGAGTPMLPAEQAGTDLTTTPLPEPAGTAMEPTDLIPPETQAEAVARILVERTYERLRQGRN